MTSEEKQYFDDLVQRLSAESAAKIEKLKKEGNAETNELIEKLKKESRIETDALIRKLNKKSKKEMEHYIGGLMEQYKWDLAAILENTKGTPAMYEKVEMIFENMGQQQVDIAILKEAVLSHKKKFQRLGV